MIKNVINKYRSLEFEEKTLLMSKFSICFNFIMIIIKCIIAIWGGVFFFVSAVFNMFMMFSKVNCYVGIRFPHRSSFNFRNNVIAVFLILAGIQYAIYMGRLLYSDVSVMKYDMVLGISIATISFVELAIAIYGCFKVLGKGHFYRNIKLINLCSGFTAIALTEMALMSFAYVGEHRIIDGIFGLIVGFITVLIGIFTIIIPKFSILDRNHRKYKLANKNCENNVSSNEIKIKDSRFYYDYYFKFTINGEFIDGEIIKGRLKFFEWNIIIKILVITLSEILIFPYAIGALINFFKNNKLISRLDKIMIDNGYELISESEK